MKVVMVSSDALQEFNSSYWRGVIPANALNKLGHEVTIVSVETWMKDRQRELFASADLIVIQRVLIEESIERASFWKQRGKAVVVDIDDGYSLLQDGKTSGNQASKFWHDGEVEVGMAGGFKFSKKLEVHPLQQFRQALPLITGMTMPSKILMEDWKAYAPCWYVPNYLDAERYLPWKRKYEGKPEVLTIGWGGSMSHKLSFERSGIAEALRRVFRDRRNVRFLLAGDHRILDILKLPPDRVEYQNYVTYAEWPRVLARMDIGVAPLQGRYDWSRSAIKSTEFSLMGIPFVATGCPTYQEHMEADIGVYVPDSEPYDRGTIAKRASVWYSKLCDVIDNWQTHKDKLDSQFDKSLEWSIERRVGDVAGTYESIIAHG